MNKKKKWFLAVLCLVLGLMLFTLVHKKRNREAEQIYNNDQLVTKDVNLTLLSYSNIPSDVKPDTEAKVRNKIQSNKLNSSKELAMWKAPIVYYGLVVDENNKPIKGVQVSYGANSMDESGKEDYRTGITTSGADGRFKIDGVVGIGLLLQLTHSNYYPYRENSTGFDKRSIPQKGFFPDSEQNAELFRMHSKGNPVPLIFRSGGFHAPNNGAVAFFPLRGNTRSEILGQLQIQGWSGVRSETNPYDWKIQLNLPDGGIIESTNDFDFVAPDTGYSPSVVFQVSGSETTRRQFFLKLPNGYIRFKLQVIMGKDMFVAGDYYSNSDGSQNLEPSEEIHPTQ